jgi:alpha-beta hydrolase superfamily lysophospholipase
MSEDMTALGRVRGWPAEASARLVVLVHGRYEHVVAGARHGVFNELDQDETIALVAPCAERVTAG